MLSILQFELYDHLFMLSVLQFELYDHLYMLSVLQLELYDHLSMLSVLLDLRLLNTPLVSLNFSYPNFI